MHFKKYAAARTAAAAILVVSTGMGVWAEEAATEEASTEAASVEETEAETFPELGGETEYPVTVYNSDGTEVVLEEEPKTVISVGPNITEIMYTLDAQDKLIARTDYCDYPEEVLELPTIGNLYEIDMEALLAMEPDLVVLSTHVSEEQKEQLEDAGIAVMYLYEEHEITGVYGMIAELGVAVNRQDEALEAVGEMEEKLAAVEAALKDEDPVSVYYVVGYGESGDYTAGGDTFINGILELAGGENIAADVEGWSYSTETLLEKDPEVIIVPAYAYDDFITAEPYSELTAVKEGRVFSIDNNILDRQCARNADAVVEVASMLHPDKAAELTLANDDEEETEMETTESVSEEESAAE